MIKIMKKASLIFAVCLLMLGGATSVIAQSSRSFSVSGFNRLDMGSAFRIDVKQGNNYKVVAEGRSQDLEDLQSSVSGGVLRLKYKNHGWDNNRKTVNISITMPSLQGVDFSGASTVTIGYFSGTGNMDIEDSGASRVTMDLTATKVSMDLSGASSLTLNGKCGVLNGEVSGASSFKGKDFLTKEVNIDASGASSASIVASDKIQAEASGASSVRYSGSVKNIHSSTSGASSVKRQ
jgi:hypothetical protein